MTDASPAAARPYPGPASFQDREQERLVFFGREQESEVLLNLVLGAPQTLLFSRSGLGKTSLVNAGLLHPLRQRGYFPVVARLTHDPTGGPLASVFECIRRSAEHDGVTIGGNPPRSSFWEYFQSANFARGTEPARPVLILDQFEELFTVIRERGEAARSYRQSGGDPVRRQLLQRQYADVVASLETAEHWEDRFVRELADVVRRRVPEAIRAEAMRRLDQMDRSDPARPAIVSMLYEGAVPDVKVVLSIREDYLPELHSLRTQIPDVFRNALRLEPFTVDQARRAIELPSQKKEVLGEDTFTFGAGVVDEMLDFLRMQRIGGRTVHGDTIEPVQLQIVCDELNRRRRHKGLHEITVAALRGRGGMKRILQDYCRGVFRKLSIVRLGWNTRRLRPSFTNLLLVHRARAAARTMCEKALITSSGHRNSLIVDEIKRRFGVPERDLTRLVDERLLRMEPRLNNYFYELSHDTLIAPVRDNMRHRRNVRMAIVGVLALLPFLAVGLDQIAKAGIERAETSPDFRILNDTQLHLQVRSAALRRLASQSYTSFQNLSLQSLPLTRLSAPYAMFDGSELNGTDLRGAVLTRASFVGANLTNARLRRADLTGATLNRAQLDGCDLTQARLDHTDVTGATLGRAVLEQSAWWLAYGWSASQIDSLRTRWPPEVIVTSSGYREQLERLMTQLQDNHNREDSATTFNELAWHRTVHGAELDKALAEVERSLVLEPGEHNALDTKGYILLQLRRPDEAVKYLKASVAADTNVRADVYPGENYYHLALALERTGNREQADSDFAAAERFGYQQTYETVFTPRLRPASEPARKPPKLPRLIRSR